MAERQNKNGTAGSNTGNTSFTKRVNTNSKMIDGQASKVIGSFATEIYDDSDTMQGVKKVDRFTSICCGPMTSMGFAMVEKQNMRDAAKYDYSQMSNTLKNAGFKEINIMNADSRADIRAVNAYISRSALRGLNEDDFLKISNMKAGDYFNNAYCVNVKISQRDIDMVNKYLNAKAKSRANTSELKNGIKNTEAYLAARGFRGVRNLNNVEIKRIISNGTYKGSKISNDDIVVLRGYLELRNNEKRIQQYQKYRKTAKRKSLKNTVKSFREADMIQGAQNVARGVKLYTLYLKAKYMLRKGIIYGGIGLARVSARKVDKVMTNVGYKQGGVYDNVKANAKKIDTKVNKIQKKVNRIDNKKSRQAMLKSKMERTKSGALTIIKKNKTIDKLFNKFSGMKRRVQNSLVGRVFHLGASGVRGIFRIGGTVKKIIRYLIIALGGFLLLIIVISGFASAVVTAISSILSFFEGTEEGPDISIASKAMEYIDGEVNNYISNAKDDALEYTETGTMPHSGAEYTITTDEVFVSYTDNNGNSLPSANLKKEILSMAAVYTEQDTEYASKYNSKYNEYCKRLANDGISKNETTYEKYYCSASELDECSNLQTDTWTHTAEETAGWTDADWDTLCKNYTTASEKTYHGTGTTHILKYKDGKVVDPSTGEECDNYATRYTYRGGEGLITSYYCKGHTNSTHTCNGHSEKFCPGHLKAEVHIVCKSLEGDNNLFDCDSLSIANTGKPWAWNYRDIKEDDNEFSMDKWKGWDEDNRDWVTVLYEQDWYELYGISMGNGAPISTAEANEYMDKINEWWEGEGHATLSPQRQTFIKTALSKIGAWSYCLRDKPQSTAGSFEQMDSDSCINNDCSGYVSYCIWKSGFTINGIQSTSSFQSFPANHKIEGTVEDYLNQLVPGDIIFKTNGEAGRTYGHVVIFLGQIDGEYKIAECSSGSDNIGTIISSWDTKIPGKNYKHVISLYEFPD